MVYPRRGHLDALVYSCDLLVGDLDRPIPYALALRLGPIGRQIARIASPLDTASDLRRNHVQTVPENRDGVITASHRAQPRPRPRSAHGPPPTHFSVRMQVRTPLNCSAVLTVRRDVQVAQTIRRTSKSRHLVFLNIKARGSLLLSHARTRSAAAFWP